MGTRAQGIAAGSSKNNGLGSCEAHHVSSSAKEDRCVPESAMGEVEGAAEEGRLVARMQKRSAPDSSEPEALPDQPSPRTAQRDNRFSTEGRK